MFKDKILCLFQWPTHEEWQRYLDHYIYKTTLNFVLAHILCFALFYGFTYYVLNSESDSIVSTRYRNVAHELRILMPFIAYVLIRLDIYKLSPKRKTPL